MLEIIMELALKNSASAKRKGSYEATLERLPGSRTYSAT